MSNIIVVNLRNYEFMKGDILVKVDRTSVVGNPYHMHAERDRDMVCDKYADYFIDKIVKEVDTEFIMYVKWIASLTQKYKRVCLGCWCTPLRCHAETIKEYVDTCL